MTSKERVKHCLDFKGSDRVAIYDLFLEETVTGWKHQGLPKAKDPKEYFGHDFEIIPLEKLKQYAVDLS